MKGKTDNLMDYGGGTHLAKWQWDEIFSPALLVNPFESDDDAMSGGCTAPKPKNKGTKESEKTETVGVMYYSVINQNVSDCKKIWYYHTKETSGWYEAKEYVEIIQPVIKGLILAQTDDIILELNENELYDIQQLKLNYLATFRDFYADENLDEDSFGTLLTDEIVSKAYAGLRKEINDIYLKRSGKLESVSPEFELLSWGLGAVIKQISLKVAKVTIKGLSTTAFYTTIRNALGKVAKRVFKVGDEITGIKIANIKQGTNGKVAVIGTNMGDRVEPVAAALEKQGYNVELFNAKYQKEFTIEGEKYTWKQITDDLSGDAKIFEYRRSGPKQLVIDEDIPKTLMFKANKQFAEKLIKENYTIISLDNSSTSLWFNMEFETIFK
ncbi:hypothetical protein FACS189455_4690 [Bacteroidia bacterium]|nr:hypothetical protein FACS189455_4690 [Bacteroidia bacterium]